MKFRVTTIASAACCATALVLAAAPASAQIVPAKESLSELYTGKV